MDANQLYAGQPLPLNRSECSIEKIVEDVVEAVAMVHKVQVATEGEPLDRNLRPR